MMRRLLFVAIPFMLPKQQGIQAQMLMFWQPIYMALYLHLSPHACAGDRLMHFFNECILLVAIYNLVLFTPYVTNTSAI